ncbi:PTS lactose/cellobiose transporter subunit IIA [Clostridium sp. P21]|uniref:PTS lactose/cellobiose transporter subunit IIA n=1 Tax=Clostridium muellerianum TaxID=2716538 RepID=A0A7Y0HN36_9CLOT|nr:PTS lactose/cellobiose transporter subunit IIA [Clostridium muellerianum]NMM62790.1 PTS lactose/cellobiose transporter subunit IIA [Clostridium muellerianum]
MEELENVPFELILYAGNGRSYSMEAIQEAKKGNYEKADELIKKASEELGKAHEFQTKLIQTEASGKAGSVNILLVHAQDHLMTAMTVRDLALEIVELYKVKVGRTI